MSSKTYTRNGITLGRERLNPTILKKLSNSELAKHPLVKKIPKPIEPLDGVNKLLNIPKHGMTIKPAIHEDACKFTMDLLAANFDITAIHDTSDGVSQCYPVHDYNTLHNYDVIKTFDMNKDEDIIAFHKFEKDHTMNVQTNGVTNIYTLNGWVRVDNYDDLEFENLYHERVMCIVKSYFDQYSAWISYVTELVGYEAK